MTSYACELRRPSGISCGWCQPCRSVQKLAYEQYRANNGRNQEMVARHVSEATGRPVASVHKLLRSFHRKGDPASWGGPNKRPYVARPRHVTAIDDEPEVETGNDPRCRCGLRLPCNGCLPSSAAYLPHYRGEETVW